MKMIRFSQTFWHSMNGASVPLFEEGNDYPSDHPEARRCIARGIAEEVDVPDPAPQPGAEAPTTEGGHDTAAPQPGAADTAKPKAKK